MELRQSGPATQRRHAPRRADRLRLVPGDGMETASDSAAGAAVAPRRPGASWCALPRGLDGEVLEGAHAMLYERVRDGLEAYAQLTAAILQQVPCDPDLQELVESSLHDGTAATRRVNAVIGRLLDAAASGPALA